MRKRELLEQIAGLLAERNALRADLAALQDEMELISGKMHAGTILMLTTDHVLTIFVPTLNPRIPLNDSCAVLVQGK